MSEQKTLTLKKPPEREPSGLRFVERKGRYILQERIVKLAFDTSATMTWADVPLVKL